MAQRRYDHEQWARQQHRADERRQRAEVAAQKAAEREQKQAAVEAGRVRAEQLNRAAADTLARLGSILHRGLGRTAVVDVAGLMRHDPPPQLDLGARGTPVPPPVWEDYAPPEPGALGGMLGGRARYERRVVEACAEFDHARRRHVDDEAARQRWVRDETARHHAVVQRHQAAFDQHNRQVAAMQAALAARDREGVEAYLERALARTPSTRRLLHGAGAAGRRRDNPVRALPQREFQAARGR